MRPSQPSFWMPGRPARNLSVTSLPRPSLRKLRPGMSSRSVRSSLRPLASKYFSSKLASCHVVDLAQVVVQPRHLQPLGFGRDHLPARQVVQRGAPQHGLLAAGVHGHVAADAAGLGRGGVDREDIAAALGGVGHALRHHAGFAEEGGHRFGHAGQPHQLDLAQRFELLGVDDGALPGQRHGAAGVAGAAAARDDGQAEFDAARHQAGHFGFAVGGEHDERVFDTPVGGVGDVRNAAQAVELEVVLGRAAAEHAARGLAQVPHGAELLGEALHGAARGVEQFAHEGVAPRVVGRGPALLPPRPGGGAARRSASAGAWGSRAGRPRDRGCAARPRCRPALHTACAPSGRCGAPAATGSGSPRRARPAGAARSRGRRTRCSCRGSRAGAPAPAVGAVQRAGKRRLGQGEGSVHRVSADANPGGQRQPGAGFAAAAGYPRCRAQALP